MVQPDVGAAGRVRRIDLSDRARSTVRPASRPSITWLDAALKPTDSYSVVAPVGLAASTPRSALLIPARRRRCMPVSCAGCAQHECGTRRTPRASHRVPSPPISDPNSSLDHVAKVATPPDLAKSGPAVDLRRAAYSSLKGPRSASQGMLPRALWCAASPRGSHELAPWSENLLDYNYALA